MLPLARGTERALLALLLVHRNEAAPVDRLIDQRRVSAALTTPGTTRPWSSDRARSVL
jgi:hypothetical protein